MALVEHNRLATDYGGGCSETKEQAKAFVIAFSKEIRSFPAEMPRIYRTVDWGGRRGQGKRTAGTVKGGMSAMLRKEQYEGIDISGYPKLLNQLKTHKLNYREINRYVLAYSFCCNHLESMMFAILNP